MKTKKSVLIITIIVGLIIGAGVAGAALADYIAQINAHKEAEKPRLESLLNEKFAEYRADIDSVLASFTEEEKRRMTEALNAYVDQIAQDAANVDVDKEKAEITKAADSAIRELEKYIDDLAKNLR